VSDADLRSGKIRLMRTDSLGLWKPVGTGTGRIGAWKSGDAVGAFGVDVDRREVWAVVDRSGEFAASGAQDVGIRPKSGARAVLSVSGRLVTLPAAWAGRTVRVEVLDAQGRVLERGATVSASWRLGQTLSGVVRIRCLSEDGMEWERGAVLVR